MRLIDAAEQHFICCFVAKRPSELAWWTIGSNAVCYDLLQGILLTLLFTPEPLRVPLLELDRRYAYHTAGKVYHGK